MYRDKKETCGIATETRHAVSRLKRDMQFRIKPHRRCRRRRCRSHCTAGLWEAPSHRGWGEFHPPPNCRPMGQSAPCTHKGMKFPIARYTSMKYSQRFANRTTSKSSTWQVGHETGSVRTNMVVDKCLLTLTVSASAKKRNSKSNRNSVTLPATGATKLHRSLAPLHKPDCAARWCNYKRETFWITLRNMEKLM